MLYSLEHADQGQMVNMAKLARRVEWRWNGTRYVCTTSSEGSEGSEGSEVSEVVLSLVRTAKLVLGADR